MFSWLYGGDGEPATYLYARFFSKHGIDVKIIVKGPRSYEKGRCSSFQAIRLRIVNSVTKGIHYEWVQLHCLAEVSK